MSVDILMTYYKKYLKDVAKVSDSTVKHYIDAMNRISRILVQKGKVTENIYEIQTLDEIQQISIYLKTDSDYIAANSKGNNMYSAAFNHYYKFANGTGFVSEPGLITLMDTAIPKDSRKERQTDKWERSGIIKEQVIESADYMCEINPNHLTFTSHKTHNQYMEGHHALPIMFQDKFKFSLDVYANIVCLCPICHRLLHYGLKEEKRDPIDKIYYERADRLATSGIKLSKSEFEEYVL